MFIDFVTYLGDNDALIIQLLIVEFKCRQRWVRILILEHAWIKYSLNSWIVRFISVIHVPELGDHIRPNVPGPGRITLPALH